MIRTISPVDGRVYVERLYASEREIEKALAAARKAQREWKEVPMSERAALCSRFVDAMVAKVDEIAPELSWQMGRPVAHAPGEILWGFAERSRYMIAIAAETLADIVLEPKEGFTRW